MESLQKKVIGLAYGIVYEDNRILYNINGTAMTYDDAVVELGLPKLAEQRESLTITFGVDTFNNEIHNGFFEEKIHITPNTRSKHKIQEHTCRTNRYKSSAVPYMSRKLNEVFGKGE